MLKIKNTKHLDKAEEIFTEFLDKFQKYAAEAAEISKGKGNLSPADKLKALECLETRYAALSNFFTGELGYEVRLEDAFLAAYIQKHRIFAIRTDVEPQEISREEALKMGALMQGMSDESPLRAIEAGK